MTLLPTKSELGAAPTAEELCEWLNLKLVLSPAEEDIRKPWIAHSRYPHGSNCISVYGPSEASVRAGLVAALTQHVTEQEAADILEAGGL